MSDVKHGGTSITSTLCLNRKEDISKMRKGTRRLNTELEVANILHQNCSEMAGALYEKEIKANAARKRNQSCLALD